IDTIPNGATQAHPRPLHRHIEGGDRLVGDQNLRSQRQRARNTDPLPLTAGELVWVTVGDGWFEPDQAQQFAHRLHGRLARLAVHDRALRNELPNGEAGVKRPLRILEDHLDLLRYGRSCARDSALKSMSPRRISPASDSIRRTTQRASVLLPDPDSPTMPNVSPRRNASDTLLTASIPRLARRKNRLRA